MVRVDRLGEKVESAFAHGSYGILDTAVGGHDDDRHFRVKFLGGSQHAKAITFRKTKVGEDDARSRGPQRCYGLGLIPRLEDGVALALECVTEHHAERVFVFDEQDGWIELALGH